MDLGSVVAAVLRPGAPVALRDERVVISLRLVGSVLDGRARLAEISPDLAHEIQTAGSDAQATLILPTGPGPARIDIAGRQIVLPGALRDALLAALNKAPAAPPGSNVASAASAAAQTSPSPADLRLVTQALVAAASADSAGASAWNAAATTLAASGTLRTARNESNRTDGAPTAPFEAPVFDPHDPAATARNLAARVSGSGVFFEAHVAQSVRGERSSEALQDEAQQLARTLVGDPARSEARAATQLHALSRETILLTGPAWAGQAMQLDLAREMQVLPDGAQAAPADAAAVFVARLQMDLPRLGRIEVRLRLSGASVAATIHAPASSGALAHVEGALPEFAEALSARGLRPVLLQAVAPPAVA